MKIFFIFVYSSVYCLSLQISYAQEITFREFIKKGNKINDMPLSCEKYFGYKPFSNDIQNTYYTIILKQDHFVAVLFSEVVYEGHEESLEILKTYDWEGNNIDEFEYGYTEGGDYYYHGLECELIENMVIYCTETEEEGTLIEVFDENNEFIRMDYQQIGILQMNHKYRLTENGNIVDFKNEKNDNKIKH